LKKKGRRKGMKKKGRRKKGEEKGGRKQAPPRILSYIRRCPHKRSYGSLHDCMKSVHLSQFVDKFVFSSDYSKEYIQLINETSRF
jgi:hypothetical protein